MKASQLRDLTRDYAAEKIGQQEYVAERTRLIDGIVAGEIEIRYHDIEPPQPSNPARRRQWWYGAAGAALVGLLMMALVAHFLVDSPVSTASRQQPARSATPPTPGVQLLGQLDVNGDWSDEALEQIESSWGTLTVFQREDARRSAEYRRLKHETTQRIHEQEALMAAGEMDAFTRAVRLRRFGERLGFLAE